MPEPKHFMMLPNAEHSCATGILEIVPAASAWVQALLEKQVVPTFTWTINESTGEIVATLDDNSVVHSATLWYGNSCGVNSFDGKNRRDFRVAHIDNPCTCGIGAGGYCANLKAANLKMELNSTMVRGKRTYRAKMDAPTDGTWVAFFIDFKFVNPHPIPGTYEELVDGVTLKKFRGQLEFERKFPNFGGFPTDFGRFYEFTTQVSVWPNTFPYDDCSGTGCGVMLV